MDHAADALEELLRGAVDASVKAALL